jgi:hypothetical protein
MEPQRIVDDLLWPLWRGIDSGYKKKYAQSIWQQYADNIRSAAYTDRLSVFFEKLSQRLSVTIRTEDVARVSAVLVSGEDTPVIKMLREDTLALVLICRLKNEDRKADYQAAQAETKGMF